MIAVNVGDVIESYIYPGRKLRVLELGTDYPPKQAPCPTVRVELYYGEELREACFALSTVTRNFSTDGRNDPRVPNPKYRYATRFNGYEIDLGAETLPELYALMAAAGVKFSTVHPTVTDRGTYSTVAGASPTCEVEAVLNTPGWKVGVEPNSDRTRATMRVADEVRPVGVTFDWLTRLPELSALSVEPLDDDTDPQPHVVGS